MSQFTILSPAQQIAEHLREELCRGRWKGTMPGAPSLATELAVDHKAVAQAIQLLENQGLLIHQGVGRPRRIELQAENLSTPTLRVALLQHDAWDRGRPDTILLRNELEGAGHIPFYPNMSMNQLGMDVKRIANLVQRTEADAWVVTAGAREVLEWFAQQSIPAFALFGRRRELPIAGSGPDKAPICRQIVRQLISLGHRRMSLVSRGNFRLPQPGKAASSFLDELETAGIPTGAFNLPAWADSREGFGKLLDKLFETTPPTALILDEPFLYYAALHYLNHRGLQVPRNISLICTDADPGFAWCDPSVAHIDWEFHPVVRHVVCWANNVAHGNDDRRQTEVKAKFVNGDTISPVR